MNTQFPLRGFFKYSVPLYQCPSKMKMDGTLNGWGIKNKLPDLTGIDGKGGFCDVYAGWDRTGIYIAYRVSMKKGVFGYRHGTLKGDAMTVFIDTRDTRDVHRSTKYCHWYTVLPREGTEDGPPVVFQNTMPFPAPDGLKANVSLVKPGCAIEKNSYGMEVFFPSKVLQGYDPSECSRIGLFIQIIDHDHGEQFWPVPAPLPFWQDPSLWASVELVK